MSNNKKYNINLILDKSDEIIEIQIIFNILRVKLMKIGYARVSTKHQCESLDQQIKLLKKSGCSEVYSEVISGANWPSSHKPSKFPIKHLEMAYKSLFSQTIYLLAFYQCIYQI